MRWRVLPNGTHSAATPLLLGRALRAFSDGYVAVILPAYLLALGLSTFDVGLLSTTTLLGSALATLAIGAWGNRFPLTKMLLGATLLMAFTGFAFAMSSSFWPFMLIAFVGTLNPSSSDVSVFLPLEHARIAEAVDGDARAVLFARYTLAGSLFSAFGALAAALPSYLSLWTGMSSLSGLRVMFVLYGCIGVAVWLLYQCLPKQTAQELPKTVSLGPSRRVVIRLAALFAVDAFAGGLVVNAIMALWLFERFDMSVASAGAFFFWSGLCSASSQLVAPWLSKRIGLINTMVFTHIPSSLFLIAAAFTSDLTVVLILLILRALLSQMDVPARSAFVMSVVTPEERTAAASFTAVPRSLAAAAGPIIGSAFFAISWFAAPLVVCGILKVAYDLAIFRAFRSRSKVD